MKLKIALVTLLGALSSSVYADSFCDFPRSFQMSFSEPGEIDGLASEVRLVQDQLTVVEDRNSIAEGIYGRPPRIKTIPMMDILKPEWAFLAETIGTESECNALREGLAIEGAVIHLVGEESCN